MRNVEAYQRHTVQVKLPDEVFAELRAYAQQNDHSMNKQINILLRDFFQGKMTKISNSGKEG